MAQVADDDAPLEGHDGPYDAPVLSSSRKVPPEWIDYNGHMNVAYYTMAVDQAIDELLEQHLGIGESRVSRVRQGPYALQSYIRFLDEMLEWEAFYVQFHLISISSTTMRSGCTSFV